MMTKGAPVREFDPTALLFVGVAGGLVDYVRLGDIVVAEHVYAYHGGRQDPDGFHPHPRTWSSPHGLSQAAHYVGRAESWMSFPHMRTQPKPGVHFGSIAAGEVVLNSPDAPLRQQLRQHYADSVAIEMESGGVASAGHLNRSTPVLTIRGISDSASGEKDLTDALAWQHRAAVNAAAFAMALVAELGRTKPAIVRRPWVISGMAAVALITLISALLAGPAVAPLVALAAVCFWLAAIIAATTSRWQPWRRVLGVVTAAATGSALVVAATNLGERDQPHRGGPPLIQQSPGYKLQASSDPLTNQDDKVDLDSGCPGWGSMHPHVGVPRCGDLADLIMEPTELHSPDYKPRIVVLAKGDRASFETCRDRLASSRHAVGSVRLKTLRPSTELCVHTDEGNVASVRITGRSAGTLTLRFSVWKPPEN